MINIVKENNFLPVHTKLDNQFLGTDSRELYEHHLKIYPANWYYRTAPVNYTLNTQHYRCPEFNTIDWANSIVIFGCSRVFGVGVDDEFTVSNQLSKLISKPVINMGTNAASMTFSLHNAIILRAGYPMPLGVVNIWTDYPRTAYYKKDCIVSYGPWNIEKGNYMDSWSLDPTHGKVHGLFASKTSKLLWENTKHFEFTTSADTAKLLDCKHIPVRRLARDCMHPGNECHYKMAEKIANNLKL
jgi:hypothetical protein